MRMRRNRIGVSLAELLIAMAVIAVGMSGVAASLYYGQRQSQHGDELAKASQYAKTMIELIKARSMVGAAPQNGDLLPANTSGLNDDDAAPSVPLSDPPFVQRDFLGYWTDVEADQDDSARELVRFTRKIQMERIAADGDPDDALARITVTIFWDERSEGGSKNNVTLSALIPVESRSPLW